MLNRIVGVKKQDLIPFNCVQVKLLVLKSNTSNHLIVCKKTNYKS